MQAYRLELKSGESRLLTSASQMDRTTVTYLPNERTICYFDRNALVAAMGSRTRTIYEIEEGWERTPALVFGVEVGADAEQEREAFAGSL